MTDGDVLNAVRRVRSAHRAALTRAARTRTTECDSALRFFGETDVERAARENAIRRADLKHRATIEAADRRRSDALAVLRTKAGAWAELVPVR